MTYPKFNYAHPPLMTDPDVFPPLRSESDPLGKPFAIQKKDFFGVHDPKYPWVGMAHNSPLQWKQWKKLRDDQANEVDHYMVVRSRYWSFVNRVAYGATTEAAYSYSVGTTYTHSNVEHQSTTTNIGVDLGLELGGNLFGGGEAPPDIPPVAIAMPLNVTTRLIADDDDGGGDGSTLSAHFTYELSKTLEFTTTDERSYTTSRTISKTTTFQANYQYLYWQIVEELETYRVPVGSTDASAMTPENRIGSVTSKTAEVYVQPFDMNKSPSNGDGGG